MSHRWKRAPPGCDPGNAGGAGRPVPRTGTWPRRAALDAGEASQLVGLARRRRHGPSISYMEGPCLILPGRKRLARPGTPATAGMRAAMIGDPVRHGRGSQVPRLGTRAACPAGCAASIRCPPSWAMASRPRPDPRPACRPPRAITGMLTRCCVPARDENVLQALLCTTMWITCVKRRRACARLGGNAGDRVTGRARNRAFTWGSAINALWTAKASEFVHTPRRNSA